jgi:DnaJ-class molecular chaperone
MVDDICGQFLGGFEDYPQLCGKSTSDLIVEIMLSPVQARRGGNVRVRLPVRIKCPICSHNTDFGHGCWRCAGRGVLEGEKHLIINYPPELQNNHSMKVTTSGYDNQAVNLDVIFRIR